MKSKTANATAVVTITVEGTDAIAVFPTKDVRVELHPGDKATFESQHLVIEPSIANWRASVDPQ